MKLIIIAMLIAMPACAENTADIISDSAIETLSWATRGLSTQPVADEAVSSISNDIGRAAAAPAANAAAAKLDEVNQNILNELNNERRE